MILLNEKSFVGQANSLEHAGDILRSCARLINSARRIFRFEIIASHSSLFQRRLHPEFTLEMLLYSLMPNDKDTCTLFIRTVKSGPYTDRHFEEHACNCYYQKRPIVGHPIALSVHGRGRLVSLAEAGIQSAPTITVNFCQSSHISVAIENIVTGGDLRNHERTYIPHPKHARGGYGTLMDLDDEEAQEVLESGFAFGRRIYGLHRGTYYVFNFDNFQGYHGYPVEVNTVPAEALHALGH